MPRRRRIQLDLADDLAIWLAQKTETGGFDTPAEYIRHLLRLARDRDLTDQIDATLLASERSGPPHQMTPKDWKQLLKRAETRAAQLRPQFSARRQRRSA